MGTITALEPNRETLVPHPSCTNELLNLAVQHYDPAFGDYLGRYLALSVSEELTPRSIRDEITASF